MEDFTIIKYKQSDRVPGDVAPDSMVGVDRDGVQFYFAQFKSANDNRWAWVPTIDMEHVNIAGMIEVPKPPGPFKLIPGESAQKRGL